MGGHPSTHRRVRPPNRDPPTLKHSRDTGTPTPEQYQQARPSSDTPLPEPALVGLSKEASCLGAGAGQRVTLPNAALHLEATAFLPLPQHRCVRGEVYLALPAKAAMEVRCAPLAARPRHQGAHNAHNRSLGRRGAAAEI